MKQEAVLDQLPGLRGGAHLGLELRHLRYLIAVADAGTITQAAEQISIAQPTLSQQILFDTSDRSTYDEPSAAAS